MAAPMASPHALGGGATCVQAFRGATWQAAVLNPRLLPSRSFEFLVPEREPEPEPEQPPQPPAQPALRRCVGVQIEQRWDPKRRSDGTGACVWDAAVALCDFLCERPAMVEGRSVVELGSGCGLLAIVAGLLGARCVHATDLPQALLLLARNVWLNTAAPGQERAGGSAGEGGGVHVGCCNWGDESHATRVRSQCPGGRVDVIIGSDLIYQLKEESQESRDRVRKLGRADNSASVALLTTIASLATPGHTRILFLGRFRVKEDADFLRMATERGFTVEVSDTKGRQGTADYQLIELGWPSNGPSTVAPSLHGSTSRPSTAPSLHGSVPDIPASRRSAALRQPPVVSGFVDGGRSDSAGCSGSDSFVLQKGAFAQLQQALSSSAVSYPAASAAGQGCLDLD